MGLACPESVAFHDLHAQRNLLLALHQDTTGRLLLRLPWSDPEFSEVAYRFLGALKFGAQSKLEATDASRHTLLHLAARCGDALVVDSLIKLDFNTDEMAARGMTPLHIAANAGNLSACRALLKHGAKTTIKSKGKTAAEIAKLPAIKRLINWHTPGSILMKLCCASARPRPLPELNTGVSENACVEFWLSCQPRLDPVRPMLQRRNAFEEAVNIGASSSESSDDS